MEAKKAEANLRVPVEDLGQLPVGGVSGSIREDDSTERVSLQIGSMRIKFSSRVRWVEIQPDVVDESDSLEISWGFHPLNWSWRVHINSQMKNE